MQTSVVVEIQESNLLKKERGNKAFHFTTSSSSIPMLKRIKSKLIPIDINSDFIYLYNGL